jgi:hypothetical protein
MLKYVELKSGHSDNGPAWIGYVTPSKSGRTLYFNGHALLKLKGQRREASGGNYIDVQTSQSFWVSGVKKNREDRHWAGSGRVLVEAAALSEYLNVVGADALDKSRYEVTHSVVQTDIEKFERWQMKPGKTQSPAQPTRRREVSCLSLGTIRDYLPKTMCSEYCSFGPAPIR